MPGKRSKIKSVNKALGKRRFSDSKSTDTTPTPKVNRIFANKNFLSQSERKPTSVATKRTMPRTRKSTSPVKSGDTSSTKSSSSSQEFTTTRLTRSKGNSDTPRTRSKLQSK